MADILGFDVPLPSTGEVISSSWLMYGVAIVCFLLAFAIIIYFIYMKRIFNKRIIVFENVAGQGYQVVHKDSARLIKVGDGGEEVLFLRKKKCFRTAYGRKMGKNEYWFAIGQDGYWYNIILGDLDAKMGMLDVEPIDRDMRYMHVAIRRNIQERYRKINFMEKYGAMVISMVAVLLFLIGCYFILDKMAEVSGGLTGAVEAARSLQESSNAIVSSLDNLCAGGSGITPAS